MNRYGLRTGIKLDVSINELPIDVHVNIRDALDQNPEDKDWRALVRAVESKFIIKQADVERWSPALNGGGSAAKKLLTCLSTQGMEVGQLRDYLRQLNIDTYTLGLDAYEDIKIVKQPPTDVEVYEGDPLIIDVEATSLPFPLYQWFFCPDGSERFDKLQGRTESRLYITNVSRANAGSYACQIRNLKDGKYYAKLTENTIVIVSANPNPIHNGLNCTPMDIINACLPLTNGHINQQQGLVERFQGTGISMCYNLIIGQPNDVTVGMNEPFVLSVVTQGDPPITYQWFKNNVKLEGQVLPKLHINHAVPSDFGYYHCIVRNGIKMEQSNRAHVKEKFQAFDTEILIVSQPKSVQVQSGGSALFNCEAKCKEPLKYQWFKNGEPLNGKNSSELKLENIQDRRVEGKYQCEISVDSQKSGTKRKLTANAELVVILPSVRDNVEYHPSDKVALLIGNSEYKCEGPLPGSTKDVEKLDKSFRDLGFKVVSLLNLTKPEIENAVLNFCELIDSNVYAVFYFCGHGIEENGLSYLIPTDAPTGYTTQHCVCAQHVLDNLRKKEPPLIFMIMDICRQPGKVRSSGIPMILEKGNVKGNTAFCYATSEGMAAYEKKDGGLLVSHLDKLLHKNIGVDALVSELKEEFHTMRKHCDKQIPELRSNLQEPRRSLVDIISTKGQTEVYQDRHRQWMNVWKTPPLERLTVDEVGVVIELDFQARFSNQIAIFVAVANKGITEECVAQITNFSPAVSMVGDNIPIKRNTGKSVVVTILQDIQKLKDNLIVIVGVTMSYRGQEYRKDIRVNLGLPLVAKLKLWEQRNNFIPFVREGIEQSED